MPPMPQTPAAEPSHAFWSGPLTQALARVDSAPGGLSSAEAARRLKRYGTNTLGPAHGNGALALLARQMGSPLVLILIGAAVLSFAMKAQADGYLILIIVIASSLLGFGQEYRAANAVASLQRLVAVQVDVLREGHTMRIALEQVVPGDVLALSAGTSIPADCRLLDLRDLFVNEASLTGETFPVEKQITELPADTPLAARSNALFQGSHVVSGSAHALVMRTGGHTEFGAIANSLRIRPEQTDFERGVRQFGGLLIQITLVLVILIFAFNVALDRPVLDAFLFALALAVGLIPELLPASISVNLANGARRMAARQVVVKRLAAIEDFGSMTVLCADKTGTLTLGQVTLAGALDAHGAPSTQTLRLAAVNAAFQSAFRNPIDEAIKAATGPPDNARRLDEIPYDFHRKCLSVLAQVDGQTLVIAKGALAQILAICNTVTLPDGGSAPLGPLRAAIEAQYAAFGARGLRTLGVAYKPMGNSVVIGKSDEKNLSFAGFVLFEDPPKPGIADTLAELRGMGVAVKIITGDHSAVAIAIARQIGLANARVVTGNDLRRIGDDALPQVARATDIFTEVEPNQKERIIRALRKAGHVVGYLGDGINDAPALHAADVGLSVQNGADVARDAADIVLLASDLRVLAAGVREGRKTFANTLKYVFMATSANFGNMLSMAAVSLFMPFLPLLPKQILLTNLLTDLPEMSIANDRVDAAAITRPQRWDMAFIRDFMLHFGLLSSVFDLLTFAVLHFLLAAPPALFRSGWFVESVVSASLAVLVIRTRGPFWASRPSRALLLSTLAVVAATVALPYTSLGALFGFAPLPAIFLGWMGLIVLGYLSSAEWLKHRFHRHRAGDMRAI